MKQFCMRLALTVASEQLHTHVLPGVRVCRPSVFVAGRGNILDVAGFPCMDPLACARSLIGCPLLSLPTSAITLSTCPWISGSSDIIRWWLQGHALFTRQAGSDQPCPPLDFTGGFNKFFGAAFNLTGTDTIESRFGAPFGEPHLLHLPVYLQLYILPSWQD